jgi:hypothetical protein
MQQRCNECLLLTLHLLNDREDVKGRSGRTISSKKMMQGAAARAVAKSARTARSLSPSHCRPSKTLKSLCN